jgi:hypothetical protein
MLCMFYCYTALTVIVILDHCNIRGRALNIYSVCFYISNLELKLLIQGNIKST